MEFVGIDVDVLQFKYVNYAIHPKAQLVQETAMLSTDLVRFVLLATIYEDTILINETFMRMRPHETF